MQQSEPSQSRVILFHNNPTSARLRFLKFPYHSICAFKPLPTLSSLMEGAVPERVSVHPAVVVKQVEEQLGLSSGDLQTAGEFTELVDVAGGPISVHLLGFTSYDPPFELAEELNAVFIDLGEARDLPQVELELLRRAYDVVLGNYE